MKHYMTTLLALALIVLGTSCRKEKDINLASRVILSQTEEITIISQGAPDFRFEVESDGDWVVVAPRWIKATPANGNGNDVVTLSFQDNWTDGVENGTRHGQVNVECASGATSFVVCQQGDPAKPSDEIKAITIGEFITLPENGQIYELTGIVANISNMTYGNFDLVDETGSIYIYGVLDPDGNPKNFATLDVEEGDQLTIQGSLGHYGDKLEVINAQYISHVKSLVRCLDASPVKIAKEEGEVTLRVQYKGEDLKVFVNANWLTFRGVGKELETTLVNFQAQANTEATARTAKVTLSSSKGDKVSSITVEIRQDPDTGGGGGTMTDMSTITGAADDTQVEATNVYVSGSTTRGYVATDGKVAVYVYTSSAPTVEVGDRVNFSGKKTTYYGLPEITNPQTDVVSKGNTVPYPTPKDITSGFDSYTADIAEYVTVEATAFKDGNYTNFRVAGATTYTLALSSAPTSIYDGITEGTKVQVTGYFNTINATRKQIQVIAVKVEKK